MAIYKCLVFLPITAFIFACNASSSNTTEVTSNYILITTAIKSSKESRLKFQDKFATALDSFFLKNTPMIDLAELKRLLEDAKNEIDGLIAQVKQLSTSLNSAINQPAPVRTETNPTLMVTHPAIASFVEHSGTETLIQPFAYNNRK